MKTRRRVSPEPRRERSAKPQTAFDNVKADVLAEKLPGYRRPDFCEMIRATPFAS